MANKTSKPTRFAYNHPLLIFITLIILEIIATILNHMLEGSSILHWIVIGLRILVSIYFLISIVHLIRISLNHFMKPKNLISLLWHYMLFIAAIIMTFSTIFTILTFTHLGYLTYGQCAGPFDSTNTTAISNDYLYFSAITFFTVGYGDICPVGLAKTFSVLGAFVGHIISVFLVALILNNYMQKRNKEQA